MSNSKDIIDYSKLDTLEKVIEDQEVNRRSNLISSIEEILPNKLSKKNKNKIATEIADNIDETVDDTIKEQYKNNLITFSTVVTGRVRVDDYLTAIKYVTYRNTGLTIKESYCLAKADEVQKAKLEGVTDDQIYNRALAYSQNKVVKDIQSQNQMPLHIVFGDAIVDGIHRMHDIIKGGSNRDAVGAFEALTRAIMPKEDIELKVDTSAIDSKIEEMNKAKLELSLMVVDNVKSGNLSMEQLLSKVNKSKEVIEGEFIEK